MIITISEDLWDMANRKCLTYLCEGQFKFHKHFVGPLQKI